MLSAQPAQNFHKPPRQPHSVTTQADPCSKTQEQISHTKHSMFQTPVQTCPSLSMFVFMELLPDRKERECLTHTDSSSQGKLSPAAPADLQGAWRALHHCSPVPGSTRAPYEKQRSCYQHLNLGKSGTMRVDKKRGATVLHPTNSSFHILSAPSGMCPQSRPPPPQPARASSTLRFQKLLSKLRNCTKSFGVPANPLVILKHQSQPQPRINMLSRPLL